MIQQFKVNTQEINYNRIFLLSDLHFGVRSNSLEWLTNQKDFFREWYIPFLKDNIQKGDILFILGDWFDNRQLLDIYVMNNSIDIIFELSKIIPIYFLTGNHDIYKKYDTDVNSIAAFKFIPNVTVFEKPIIITNKDSKILILPWIGNKEDEENYIRANKFDYVFAHIDMSGFRYDNGKEITTAADFSNFKEIKKLFSGHIHKRQERKNLIYLGSPYHTKRGDIGNTKGAYIFNPKDNTYDFKINNFSPIFQRIMLDGILELTLEDTIKILNNNYTDIVVSDKYINLFNLTKFIDILKTCNYKKIETISEQNSPEEEISNFEGVDIRDILTLLEIGIEDLGHQMEVTDKLKLLNKEYYDKATKEE